MKDKVCIGSSINRLVTKKELIKIIDENFEDDNFKSIANITTIDSDVNNDRVRQQSITFSKVLTL